MTPHKREVVVGGGSSLWSTHIGTVQLNGSLSLDNVLFVPALGCNLISVTHLLKAGVDVWFQATGCSLSSNGTRIGFASLSDGLYVLQASPRSSTAHPARTSSDLLSYWHRRLGHLNFREVFRLGSDGLIAGNWKSVTGHDISYSFCDDCVQGKGRRLPTHPNPERAPAPHDLVHIDLWGPARTTSIGGNRYFLTCRDDATKYTRIYPLKQRSGALQAFGDYIQLVKNQTGKTIKRIRQDGGGELTSCAFTRLLAQHGILPTVIPPDNHAQAGRVERVHLTILNLARTYLIDSDLPMTFWAEACNYAVYVRNLIPDARTRKVPYTTWCDKQVSYDHLRPFGSELYFKDHTETNKLRPRYRKGYLLGWREDSTHFVRYWDPIKRTVNYSRDIVYDPNDTAPSTSTTSETPPADVERPLETVILNNLDADTTSRSRTIVNGPAVPHAPRAQRFREDDAGNPFDPASPPLPPSPSPAPPGGPSSPDPLRLTGNINDDVSDNEHVNELGSPLSVTSSIDELALSNVASSLNYATRSHISTSNV